MAERGLERKDLEEIFTGFEKRQDEKFQALEGRMDSKTEGLEERVVNQFHIISEGLMDHIKLLSEGHAGIIERLDRMEKENEHQHMETRALVKLSFSELDRRLSDLES
jgi:acetyl-CoA carboxylase carboxyltransferase component